MNKLIFKPSECLKVIAWVSNLMPSLKDRKYVIEIKEHHEKRSLDANAYCWVLIDKLSEVLHNTLKQDKDKVKVQIYRNAIKDIGGVSDTICVKSETADKVCEMWSRHGIGWQTEQIPSKIDGCTNITLYYGSSTFDSKQMARLIENIVVDCKAVGIETMTPDELERMKEEWEK